MITITESFPLVTYSLIDNQIEIGEATVELGIGRTAYIQRIDVNDPGKGYGTTLLNHVLADLKSRRIWHVRAYVNHHNPVSNRLFTKLGFTKEQSDEWCAAYGDYLGKNLCEQKNL